MNFSSIDGGGDNNDAAALAASGWESLLGWEGFMNDSANNITYGGGGANTNNNNGTSGAGGNPDPYAAYLMANYPQHSTSAMNGGSGGVAYNIPPYNIGGVGGGASSNNLAYNVHMPQQHYETAAASLAGGGGAGGEGHHRPHYFSTNGRLLQAQERDYNSLHYYNQQPIENNFDDDEYCSALANASAGSLINGGGGGISNNNPDNYNNNIDPYSINDGINSYYNTNKAASNTHGAPSQIMPPPPPPNGTLGELDYCDAILRTLDDSSSTNNNLGWLAGALNGGRGTAAVAASVNGHNSHSAMSSRNNGGGSDIGGGYNSGIHTGGTTCGGNEQYGNNSEAATSTFPFGGGGVDTTTQRMAHYQLLHQQYMAAEAAATANINRGRRGTTSANGASTLCELDDFIASQLQHHHHHQQQAQTYLHQKQRQPQRPQRQFHRQQSPPLSMPAHQLSTKKSLQHQQRKAAGNVSSMSISDANMSTSTRLAPNRADHSSLPSAQIDPILERISLTVTAVSLTPLSGNEVLRHIRTKTDDVITRFLPCVDFLVNCQQELRQGLAVAQAAQAAQQNRRKRGGAGSRSLGGMTPRQFHATYVAPLPRRFVRQNESLMASDCLRVAGASLESLVRDADTAIPQGCDHVKNAFLGGMRENESWGLRKWLSMHGGAGSICNDIEEVMRHVKALPKSDDTTRRLADMLRPIARQAHDRLKKDVPTAYQERSSAHPYLPFFHRLEACLKQMATYDPEEDDVICLADSSDDEEAIKVVSSSPVKSHFTPQVAANMAQSSPVKKRDVMKRKCTEDINPAFVIKWAESEGVAGEHNIGNTKQSRLDPAHEYADQYFGKTSESNYDDDINSTEKKKTKSPTKEPEIICLDDDDEEDIPATASQTKLSHSPPPKKIQDISTTTAAAAVQWRCIQCTFLNEAMSMKCVICKDDDSVEG